MYPNDFKNLIMHCREVFNNDRFIIGGGNPNSQILFVGQEPSGDAGNTNTLRHYEDNISFGIEDPYIRERKREQEYCFNKGEKEPNYWRNHGALWNRYQLLYDLIIYGYKRPHDKFMDFETEVFCSEMNGSPSTKHINADLATLPDRKTLFFTNPYFKRFKVIILACGHCIENAPGKWEINDIFNVHLDQSKPIPEYNAPIRYNFWSHIDDNSNRIVIHTTNLSGPIQGQLITAIADTTRKFLDEHYPNMLKK